MASGSVPEDDEFWVDVKGYEGLYRVSSHGRVMNVRGYKPREVGCVRKNGYKFATLCNRGVTKQVTIHRLVLMSFSPQKREDLWCLHRDGNKLNNKISNLYWGTAKDNYEDSRRHGTNYRGEFAAEKVRGEKSPTAKLKDFHIIEIRKIYSSGISQRRLGELYGVDATTIKAILKGNTWSHVKSTAQ